MVLQKIAVLFVEGSFAHGRPLYRHPEDGELHIDYSAEEVFFLVLHSKYGVEYRHHHHFPTWEKANDFLVKVENALNEGRSLDLGHWHHIRVIYGTQAYLDEEPYIVQREKDDALWNEYFH